MLAACCGERGEREAGAPSHCLPDSVPQTLAGGLRPPAPLLMIGEIRSSLLHGWRAFIFLALSVHRREQCKAFICFRQVTEVGSITLPARPVLFYRCLLRRCIVRRGPRRWSIPSLNDRGN